jgi:hypothetical protein
MQLQETITLLEVCNCMKYICRDTEWPKSESVYQGWIFMLAKVNIKEKDDLHESSKR